MVAYICVCKANALSLIIFFNNTLKENMTKKFDTKK